MDIKLDILAFGAHPDDVELGAGGTLAKHSALGHSFGIIDLTKGEMGTRGTPEIRLIEAGKAAEILGTNIRENLEMRDGFLVNDEESQLKVIQMIRKYRPDIILCNAPNDRHPDHGIASKMVVEAAFKAGFKKLKTNDSGVPQESWRPKSVYHYIQYYDLTPDFIVDISGFMDQKMESISAHSSQFYDPNSKEPETVISGKQFFSSIRSRGEEWGRLIYSDFGEGFIKESHLGVDNLLNLK